MSFLAPLAFPQVNLYSALSKPESFKPPPPVTLGYITLFDNLTSFAASFRSWALAMFCMYYITDSYPAFGRAKVFEFDWMWPILLRNVVACWLICGLWDWFLYLSPFKSVMHKFKFNQAYPPMAQLKHDSFWTTTAMFTAAAVEIVMCHLYATGRVAYQANMMETPIQNALWIIFITHWRIPHFYMIHRAMHPWKTTRVPDIGKFLYAKVHRLHHKSPNPTAFSGTNMHPVESTLYWSAAFIAVAGGCHPSIFLGCIVDCAVGAWLGHDGFTWPGTGDYFHYLHHAHFDCNYGAAHVPLDKWFGTFASAGADIRTIWGKSPSSPTTASPTSPATSAKSS